MRRGARIRRFGIILAGAWLLWACLCPQASAAGARSADAVATTRPAEDDLAGELRRILLNRPSVPITRPKGYVGPKQPGPAQATEGATVTSRRCRAEQDASGWVLLVFENPPDKKPEPPRWALPCALLERMEAAQAATPAASFSISGETTTHDGRSFLLLRKVIVIAPGAKAETPVRTTLRSSDATPLRSTSQDPAKPKVPDKPRRKTPPATAKPASRPAATKPAAPSPEEIMKRLLRDKPGKPIVVPTDDVQKVRGETPSVAPVPKGDALPVGRGNMVVDRLVTLLPAGVGRWLQVNFESDNTLREPPLRLLPCRLLSRAEDLARSGQGRAVRLRVSGEITRYKGRRYLLLRKIYEEKNLDRF